jgi:hypothetical protein
LYDLSDSLDVLDATDLAKISNFSACLPFYNTFTWSSSQATALAGLAKVLLNNIFNFIKKKFQFCFILFKIAILFK